VYQIPTSASWLNAIEGFFATLSKRRLKRDVFRSVGDLQAAINCFLDDHDAHCKPFRWVAGANKIIARSRTRVPSLGSLGISLTPVRRRLVEKDEC